MRSPAITELSARVWEKGVGRGQGGREGGSRERGGREGGRGGEWEERKER